MPFFWENYTIIEQNFIAKYHFYITWKTVNMHSILQKDVSHTSCHY